MPQQRFRLLSSLLVRIAVAWVVSTIVLMTSPLQAQTFSVLHSFTGGADGSLPEAGLTLAGDGRFYGTTAFGGNPGAGVVYRLSSVGTGWILTPLFAFPGGYYGDSPRARAIIGPNGTLFGTTYEGGYYEYGTVYNLQPGVNVCTAATGVGVSGVPAGTEGGAGDGGVKYTFCVESGRISRAKIL